MTIDETIKWFNSIHSVNSSRGDTKDKFFCGMTSDIETIKKRNARNFLCFTKCNTSDTAKNLVKLMMREGYSANSSQGEGDDRAIYVYMLKN